MNSVIRWSKSDEIRLGKAVAEFNRKIKKLEQFDNLSSFLPSTRNYRKLRYDTILTRRGLNNTIKALRSFQAENQKLVDLPSRTKYDSVGI